MLVEALLGYARAHAAEMVLGGGEGEGERWQGLVLVHAQVGVEGWYTSLGFERDEGMGVWVEEGIGHVGMWRRVEVGGDGGGEGGF